MTSVDTSGRTPLHCAASQNDVVLVAALLTGGADVDAADHDGVGPLHLACQERAVEAAHAFLVHGAEVEVVNRYGNTPPICCGVQLARSRRADPYVEGAWYRSIARK